VPALIQRARPHPNLTSSLRGSIYPFLLLHRSRRQAGADSTSALGITQSRIDPAFRSARPLKPGNSHALPVLNRLSDNRQSFSARPPQAPVQGSFRQAICLGLRKHPISTGPAVRIQPKREGVLSNDRRFSAIISEAEDPEFHRQRQVLTILDSKTSTDTKLRSHLFSHRELDRPVWSNNRILQFDIWTGPSNGVHFVLGISTMRRIWAKHFDNEFGLEWRHGMQPHHPAAFCQTLRSAQDRDITPICLG